MNNTTIVYSAFVLPEELWKSRRVLSAEAVFLDLYNSSDDTHPHSIIVNYMAIMLLLTEFSRQKSPLQPITFTGMNLRQKGLHHKMAIPFLAFQYGVFVTLE